MPYGGTYHTGLEALGGCCGSAATGLSQAGLNKTTPTNARFMQVSASVSLRDFIGVNHSRTDFLSFAIGSSLVYLSHR
jgi:uncharacterized protein (DUF2237 family)